MGLSFRTWAVSFPNIALIIVSIIIPNLLAEGLRECSQHEIFTLDYKIFLLLTNFDLQNHNIHNTNISAKWASPLQVKNLEHPVNFMSALQTQPSLPGSTWKIYQNCGFLSFTEEYNMISSREKFNSNKTTNLFHIYSIYGSSSSSSPSSSSPLKCSRTIERREADKTWARSTFANNKQHKAAGYCPAVARLPDKAKDLGCLFKIVSCLFEPSSVVLTYNAALLTRHLKFFDSNNFQNTAKEL